MTIQYGQTSNGNGGGIANSGNLTATNDTISNNTAGIGIGNFGGNGGGINNSGTLTATNDTISNNTAGNGGGIFNGGGTLTATNDTISGNTAGNGSVGGNGGGIFNGGGTLTLAASIIADQNSGGNCTVNGGAITDAGYNLDSDGTCGLTSSIHSLSRTAITLPTLITVGSTQVIPIAPLSPAFDVIPSTSLLCTGGNSVVLVTGQPGINIPSTDQVGNPRIVKIGSVTANYCSIGAYQDQVTAPNAPTGVAGNSGANGQSTITWSAPLLNGGSPITGYTVEYSTSASGTYSKATMCTNVNPTSNTLSCTVTGLTNGTTYYFEVFAANQVGVGPVSIPSSGVTPVVKHHHHHHHRRVNRGDDRRSDDWSFWRPRYFHFFWDQVFFVHYRDHSLFSWFGSF